MNISQILCALSAIFVTFSAHAGEINVTTFDDELNADGDCSLREAVEAANQDVAIDACAAGSGTDTIYLQKGVYALEIPGENEDGNQTGDLDVTGQTSIVGRDAAISIIDGFLIDRVLDFSAGGSITGVTVTSGDSSADGGAIRVSAGGLTIRESEILDSFADGFGGGVSNANGTLELIDTLIAGNQADLGGGGVYSNSIGPQFFATNTTFSGNSTGGGTGGAALIAAGDAQFNNCTIAANLSNGLGEVGGLSVTAGTTRISNTIIATNTASGGSVPDLRQFGGGDIDSGGFNLIGDSSNSGVTFAGTDQVGDGMSPIDPLLQELGDNGGPTWTHALSTGSPAVDQGNSLTPTGTGDTCETADARGVSRPVDGDGNSAARCDIGALENVETSTSVFRSNKRKDGFVIERGEDLDVGGKVVADKRLKVGDNRGDRRIISKTVFRTSALPDTAVVLRAFLTLQLAKTVGTDPLTTHGRLVMDVESAEGGLLRRSDFQHAAYEDGMGEVVATGAPVFVGEIEDQFLSFIDLDSSTAIYLNLEDDDNDDQGTDTLVFGSGDDLVALKPTLTVIYYVP